jgi:Flp pilus assembly protein TadD
MILQRGDEHRPKLPLRTIDRAYLKTKKPKEAIADFSRAIDIKPDDGSFFAVRAEAYKLLGRPDLAKKDYDTVNQLGGADDIMPSY